MTNRERAERAAGALIHYVDLVGGLPPDAHDALSDFITDSMHLLGRDVVLNSLRMAEIHHQAEIEEGGAE